MFCAIAISFYSLVGYAQTVTGSGTTGYIPKWTGSTTLANSVIFQTGSKIGIATTTPTVDLDVGGRINAATSYRLQGLDILAEPNPADANLAVGPYALVSTNSSVIDSTAVGTYALTFDTSGQENTALGSFALYLNTTGSSNTALGDATLLNNTEGYQNTASGYYAMGTNTTGNADTAMGFLAMYSNQTGVRNTAVGQTAMYSNTVGTTNTSSGWQTLYWNTSGNYNTAIGANALFNNQTGSNNTAVGENALSSNSTGSNNIALGMSAGWNVPTGSSNNIEIGAPGAYNDNGAIRIGVSGTQTSFFAAGVSGVPTGLNNAVPVMIDSNGQFGTVSSSRRFKEDIQEMGDASLGLLSLRPVTFRYKKAFADGSKPVQYGLIAEEVAEVYPDLITHSPDGQIETVIHWISPKPLRTTLPLSGGEQPKSGVRAVIVSHRLAAPLPHCYASQFWLRRTAKRRWLLKHRREAVAARHGDRETAIQRSWYRARESGQREAISG